MPEDGGTAYISGYLRASIKASETTVKGWLFDAPIMSDIKKSFSLHARSWLSGWSITLSYLHEACGGAAASGWPSACCTACGRSMIPAGCCRARSRSLSKSFILSCKATSFALSQLNQATLLGAAESFQLCIGLQTSQQQKELFAGARRPDEVLATRGYRSV